MDEYEEKLKALEEKTRFEEHPSLWDQLKMLWYMNRIIARRQRTLNALKWIYLQNQIRLYLRSFYIVYFIGMPTEKDIKRARKAKDAKEAKEAGDD